MAQDLTYTISDYALTLLGAFGGGLRGWIELIGNRKTIGTVYLVEGPLPTDHLQGNGRIVMHQPVSRLESLLTVLRAERSLQLRLCVGVQPPAIFLETATWSIQDSIGSMKMLEGYYNNPAAISGDWSPLLNQPSFAASTMLLLTDGTVLCQVVGGRDWWKLTPDRFGDYLNGTWSPIAPMQNARLHYVSAVLADGRVFVSGGECSDAGKDTAASEIYDPVTDTWTSLPAPLDWEFVGDAASCVLADGKVMIGAPCTPQTALFDPRTDSWSPGPSMQTCSAEETWTLLPDHSVLTVACGNSPEAERYVPGLEAWVSAGRTPVELVEASSIEIGPAVLMPDGQVFAIGATGHTALYTQPEVAAHSGVWTVGPDFPVDGLGQTLGAKDAPACLLPNGRVLCTAGPVNGVEHDYLAPTYFFECDGATLLRVNDPPNATQAPFEGRLLLLPTRQALFSSGSAEIYGYSPVGEPDSSWKPTIMEAPSEVAAGLTYPLRGTQINGLSQAVSYGDDASAATNYPLVRIHHLDSGHVRYCRTFGHSTMGVATGAAIHSTHFAVPTDIDAGPSRLCVVTNGIVSDYIAVHVIA